MSNEHIGEILTRRTRLTPDREAIYDVPSERRFTYRQLNERACAVANYLRGELGVKKGDRVGILAKNGIHFVDLMYGLAKIGAILVTRRRRAWTMENRSSVYTLHRELADRIERAETPEVVQPTAPGGAADCAENYPHPTTLTPSTSTPAGADARPTPSTHSVPVARPIFDRARRQPATNPGNLNPAARRNLRQRLQHIGRLLAAGHHWWDDTTQDAVDTFTADLEHHIPDFADLEHKWSCTAAVADPYQAGVKLNKLIHTAHTGGIHPAA
jgi:acyl-CoA synthetase (AMP-forming)/AMP-acid ligase II